LASNFRVYGTSKEDKSVRRTNLRGMEETLTTLEREQDERGKVESWRLHVLMEAGYPLPIAERIAQSDADLHEAVELVGPLGCVPDVAAQILL
jgi:hypothetical protein